MDIFHGSRKLRGLSTDPSHPTYLTDPTYRNYPSDSIHSNGQSRPACPTYLPCPICLENALCSTNRKDLHKISSEISSISSQQTCTT